MHHDAAPIRIRFVVHKHTQVSVGLIPSRERSRTNSNLHRAHAGRSLGLPGLAQRTAATRNRTSAQSAGSDVANIRHVVWSTKKRFGQSWSDSVVCWACVNDECQVVVEVVCSRWRCQLLYLVTRWRVSVFLPRRRLTPRVEKAV